MGRAIHQVRRCVVSVLVDQDSLCISSLLHQDVAADVLLVPYEREFQATIPISSLDGHGHLSCGWHRFDPDQYLPVRADPSILDFPTYT